LEEIIYTVEETAKLLRTSIEQIYKFKKAGLLPFLKIGRLKVRREALLEFVKKYEGKDITDPYNISDIETDDLNQEVAIWLHLQFSLFL